MGQHVVVWDPKGEYWDGAVVNDDVAHTLHARHVVTLPCDSSLFRRSAVAGYFKRSWGAGWPLEGSIPKMHAPMVLWVGQGASSVHWAARLQPASAELARDYEEGKIAGQIRLASDSGQAVGMGGGYAPSHLHGTAQLTKLGRPDPRGGWIVSGEGTISSTTDGLFACALYGTGPGLRVAWAAVSQVLKNA